MDSPFLRSCFAAAIILLSIVTQAVEAEEYIVVSDASLVKYQINGNVVSLRNLNEFHPNAMGCCYNYHIETTTLVGKNIWTAFLAAAAQGKQFIFGVPPGFVAGPVTQGGQW